MTWDRSYVRNTPGLSLMKGERMLCCLSSRYSFYLLLLLFLLLRLLPPPPLRLLLVLFLFYRPLLSASSSSSALQIAQYPAVLLSPHRGRQWEGLLGAPTAGARRRHHPFRQIHQVNQVFRDLSSTITHDGVSYRTATCPITAHRVAAGQRSRWVVRRSSPS